jgi:serine/threonine protein kinase/Tfp pilus assembly protein PilF
MAGPQAELRAVFCEALDRKTPQDQAAYLAQACQGKPELRDRVEALLRAHAEASGFLQEPSGNPAATTDEPIREGPGTVVGPYKLLEQIGEGGFGVVFMAEQTHPVRRKVALKVLKPGMDTRQVVARFEAERQALALMDHPNIARVFDGGETAVGRPYFVMELVKGVPITDYCDQAQLAPRERLELFIPVCQAVQHAHQKGIIHRDLKPSNVLVTLHDGTPVPKIIDFGIAKALGQELTDKTLFTGFAQLIGTPLYMSPEQAALSGLDMDTRSDIYSLGVLLYELLTGTTPFDKERLRTAGYDEMRRIISEEEPPRPSTRISTLGLAATTFSAQCKSDPKRLSQLFRGELDWIVMKCLEKDRNRRYETASALARDIERYLHDEPVLACPPSAGYRLRKLARKHKKALAVSVAFAVLLAAGAVFSTWQAIRATLAEKSARDAEAVALAAEKKALEEAAVAKAVNDFLNEDVLGQASAVQILVGPNRDWYRDLKVTEALDRAAVNIAGKFAQQPRAAVAVRLAIGSSYLNLGERAKAQEHLETALAQARQALGDSNPETFAALFSVATLYWAYGQYTKAEALFLEALEGQRKVLGDNHLATLLTMKELAYVYGSQGKYAQAEALSNQALERYRTYFPDHPMTGSAMYIRASIYLYQRQYAKAEPLFKELLDGYRAVSESHPWHHAIVNRLGHVYYQQALYAQAEPLLTRALEGFRKGKDLGCTLVCLNDLALLYRAQEQLDKEEPLLRELLRHHREKNSSAHDVRVLDGRLGPNWLAMADIPARLGDNLVRQRRYAEAEPLLLECIQIREPKVRDHALVQLVHLYEAWGKPDEAAKWRKELETRKANANVKDPKKP